MPYKDIEKHRQCCRNWKLTHKEHLAEYNREYRQKHGLPPQIPRDPQSGKKPYFCPTCGIYIGNKYLSARLRQTNCLSCASKIRARIRGQNLRDRGSGFCVDCKKPISPYAKRCSPCHNKQNIYIRTPEIRKKNRQSQLMRLEDPEVLSTYMGNIALATVSPRQYKRPNKCEVKLTDLLNNLYPNEWRFTGNGDVWIGNLNPDFVSNNGKKLVIELLGTYWHNRRGLPYHNSELGRIMYFNSYGYKTLIIWEGELNDIPNLATKISQFVKGRQNER